jgi:hypothetical protein
MGNWGGIDINCFYFIIIPIQTSSLFAKRRKIRRFSTLPVHSGRVLPFFHDLTNNIGNGVVI